LDGLPLAIELAAARSKALPPAALLQRLAQRLPLLTGGSRDLPTRHQTIRATIDWSHTLLDAPLQSLFRRLGVFMGGCTLLAAEATCGFGDSGAGAGLEPAPLATLSVVDGLQSLVDQSLVQVEERPTPQGDVEARFMMLELVREYAVERLVASGEVPTLQRRHAEHYLELAEAAARSGTRSTAGQLV
jgi:predicted ATPase